MAEDRGAYLQLLHGHRRWAAAQIAGVRRVPVVIVDPHEHDEAILVMLAEDKKQAVTPADRGRAVRQLREEFGFTWEGVAARLGVSVATVRNWANDSADSADPAGEDSTGRPRKIRQQPRGDGTPPPPRIRAAHVHDLISRVDAGDLDARAAVDTLRGWLGGWQPLTANSSVSARIVELVDREDGPGVTASTIGDRLGIHPRLVQRARAVIRDRAGAS
jgi:DNA-binding XRE family transcriptional regulator